MAKISKRNIFEAVLSQGTDAPVEFTQEMIDYCADALDKMDESNAKAKVKRAEKVAANGTAAKQAAADAKVTADIVAMLGEEPMTRDEIVEAMEGYTYENGTGDVKALSAQKVSTLLAKAEGAKVVTILVADKPKKAYTKA